MSTPRITWLAAWGLGIVAVFLLGWWILAGRPDPRDFLALRSARPLAEADHKDSAVRAAARRAAAPKALLANGIPQQRPRSPSG